MSPDGRTGPGVEAGGGSVIGGKAIDGGRSVIGGTTSVPLGGAVGGANPDAAIPTGGVGGQAGGNPITSMPIPDTGGSGGGGVTTSPVDAPVLPPDAPAPLSLGAKCKTGTDCASGFCTDQVCCDGDCKGQCESCSAAGKCTTAPKGPAPTSRTACVGTGVCGGQCDGTHGAACVFPDDKTTCTPAVCKNGSVTPATVCSSGKCSDPQTPTPCPSGACDSDGIKCTGSCTDLSCGSTQYCDSSAGICVAKKAQGTGCAKPAECGTGLFCVDGVCCNSECKDQCTACNSSGVCARFSGDPRDKGRAACTETDSLCKGKCDSTSNTCVYPTTVCEAAKCSQDLTSVLTARTCSQGACSTSLNKPCGSTGYCSGSVCVDRMGDGGGCSGDYQCTSNHCTTAGICCPTGYVACTGGVCLDARSDPNNCGGCDVKCGANQTCSAGSCRCSGSSLSCGGTTVCSSTGFETGGLDGWSVDPSNPENGASSLRLTSGSTHGGTSMFYATMQFSSASYIAYNDFLVTLCGSGSAMVSSFSLWVATSPLGATGAYTLRATLTFYGASGSVVKTVSPSTVMSSTGSWYNLTGTVSAQASKVQVRFTSPEYPTYSSLYVDDVDFR